MFKFFGLFLQLLVFLKVNLLLQGNHFSLNCLKLLLVLVSHRVCRFHFGLKLSNRDVLLADLKGEGRSRRLVNLLPECLVFLLLRLNHLLVFGELLGDALLIVLKLLSLILEFDLNLKNFLFFLGDLSRSFLNFEF